jgi:C4-dicarboxylate-specific signal transduction histidine kinase
MAPIPPDTLSRERTFQLQLRECSLAFSRAAGAVASLQDALGSMAVEAAALLGVPRAAIWLHDRRARELWLAACSVPSPQATEPERVLATDDRFPAARGMALEHPTAIDGRIVAPLRGWRRALGTLIIEGSSDLGLGDEQMIELSHEVARQLSAAIENLQLLEEVLRQRRLLEDSFNSLADLVIVTDNGLRVVQTNEALAAALRRPRLEMFEMKLEAVVGPEVTDWVRADQKDDAAAAASAARPSRARTRTFVGTPLGSTVVVTVTTLVNDDNVALGRVIVARDVTQQVQLEAERETLRAQLAQSEKLASLGQFVAGVAHELNNPLQGVLGYVELMLRSPDGQGLRTELRRVLREADRAAKIVRNLLVFSGTRRMTPRRLTVERAVGSALASRRTALAKEGIDVVRRHPRTPLPISGDPLLLQQAFLNVLINAEHAIADSGSRGTIEIDIEHTDGDRSIVTRIRDSGPGMDTDVLSRAFDPFFTTKEVNKGTGLGLTIAYGIFQEHGGSITAANAQDGGAIFTITLPAAPPTARAARSSRR